MVGLLRSNNPQTWDELKRDFVLSSLEEKDMNSLEMARLNLPVVLGQRRRVQVASFVNRQDPNSHTYVARDVGPATSEPMLSIPCDDVVDYAYCLDLLEMRRAKMDQRLVEREERLKRRQAVLDEQLADAAEEMERRKKGATTVGYGGMSVQRST